MAKAIVFGGSGFFGVHLAKHLLDQGYEDVVAADITTPIIEVPGLRYVFCDVREPIALELADAGYVAFNLAAVHRTPGHPDEAYFETNLAGARHVTKFCSDLGINRLLFTSTMSVYGPSEERRTEDSKPEPVSAYGKSKLEAEAVHRAWVEAADDRRLVIVRPAVIFGRGERGNFTRLAHTLSRRVFVYPGRRDTIKACGYVEDLVASFDFAFERANPFFLYNFCYPQPYTIEDICSAFHDVVGTPRPLGTLPSGLILLAGRCFETLAGIGLKTPVHRTRIMKLLQSTNIWPEALLNAGYCFDTDLKNGLRRWQQDCGEGGLR